MPPETAEPEPGEYVSWREFLGSGYSASLALVCLAVWLHAADSLIVATMLPSIVGDIGGAAFVGWTVAIYEIGSIVAGAASALLAMRHGLRRPMSLAALLFGLGCAVSAAAGSMPILLAGRLLQGAGGGALIALAMIAAITIFPRRYVPRAVASVSTFWGASAFLGPLIGGLFVEYGNWRAGFWFFAAMAALLALWLAISPAAGAAVTNVVTKAFPLRRLMLLSTAVILIAAGGIDVDLFGTTLLVAAGLACLVVFLWLDNAAVDNRMLPLGAVDPRSPTGSALLMFLAFSIGTIAITAFGPLLMTIIHGTSALVAGYVVACSSIGWSVAAVMFSGSPERLDRHLIAIGMGIVTLSIVGFVFSVPNGPVWLIAVCATLEGAGFGMAWSFMLRRMTALAPQSEHERISAALPTIQRLGYALGASYVGIVANASGFLAMNSSADGANVARILFLACLPFAAIGFVAMIGLVRRYPNEDVT